MKYMSRLLQSVVVLSAVASLLLAREASAQSAGQGSDAAEYKNYSVRELINLAGSLDSQLIQTYGTVDTYEPAVQAAVKSFWLKGDEGGIIKVEVNTIPTPGTRVRVFGVFKLSNTPGITDAEGRYQGGYIIEKPPVSSAVTTGPVAPPVMPTPQSWWQKNMGLVVGGAALVVILLIALAVYASKLSKQAAMPIAPLPAVGAPGTAGAPAATPAAVEPVEDDETTRIEVRSSGVAGLDTLDERTVKYLPGHLEVLAGGRNGDVIPLCGGNAVTVGRIHKDGKGPAFIGLEDPMKALGRRQFVIRFSDASKVFGIENHGTNPTVLDGKEMGQGEAAALDDGAEIGTPGGYKFRFRKGMYQKK